MHITRTLAALGLAATALAVATTSPATAEDDPTTATTEAVTDVGTAAVTTNEQDCHETNIARAVSAALLRDLVPARYDLLAPNPAVPTTGRITVLTYTCFGVSVDGQPVVGRDKPTTVTIGTAAVKARDGVTLAATPSANAQQYILWYGTDNPVLFAKLQQTGLPVHFLRPSTGTTTDFTSTGTSNTLAWDIRWPGLDYTQSVTGPEPTVDPATRPATTSTFWFDGPQGDLSVTYTNHTISTNAPVTADFRANDVLQPRVLNQGLLVINGSFPYIRGGWTSAVKVETAP